MLKIPEGINSSFGSFLSKKYLTGNRILRFGLKQHSQAPHTYSNGRSEFSPYCFLLLANFYYGPEGIGRQI